MKQSSISEQPRKAPGNFRELPAKVVVNDGDGLWATWHGSGIETSKPCEACGNFANNKVIYHHWGTSYPNGNSWRNEEIFCGACGWFTLINIFEEG